MQSAAPRPWHFTVGKNGFVYVIDANDGRVATVNGPDKMEIVTLMVRAVNLYERAQQKRAARVLENEATSVSEK